jgi:hypothetical protein
MVDRLTQDQQLSLDPQLVPPNGKTNLVLQGDGSSHKG